MVALATSQTSEACNAEYFRAELRTGYTINTEYQNRTEAEGAEPTSCCPWWHWSHIITDVVMTGREESSELCVSIRV